MGQTKCCWRHGPAAWMHHKDLSLPCFFTLLQNKLSLDCVFSPQAKLSPEPDTEVAGRSWLQVHPWPSLSSSAFFEFCWCFPPPSSGLVCLLPPPALSTPSSTFLHPSSMASTAPSTLSSPHLYTVQQHEPPNCLYPSAAPAPVTPAQLSGPYSHQQLCPRSALLFPSSVIPSLPLLSHISLSKISPVHSPFWQWCIQGSSGVRACPQPCGLRACGRATLDFAKPELCFYWVLSLWLLQAHL